MAFSDKKYKTLGDVLKSFSIRYELIDCIGNIQAQVFPAALREEIHFTMNHIVYKASEEAVCENILYPILREAWKNYVDYFSMWSHKAIEYDKDLKGSSDYLICKLSELGFIVFDAPYIAVVEAKLDDFIGGWAQCALEMLAMQKINGGDTSLAIFGIVSNGDVWQFAKLEANVFSECTKKGSLDDLDELYGILIFLLEECKRLYINA